MQKLISELTPLGLAALEYACLDAMLDQSPDAPNSNFLYLLAVSSAARRQGANLIGNDYDELTKRFDEAVDPLVF